MNSPVNSWCMDGGFVQIGMQRHGGILVVGKVTNIGKVGM